MDRLGTEAQVRDGAGAGLLRVIHEIPLGKVPGLLSDDLDRVLVCAYCAVRAEAVEQAAHGFGIFGREARVVIDAGISDVIHYADCEVLLRLCLGQLVKDALDHGGRELLGREAVAASDHTRRVVALGLGQSSDHVEEERLPDRAGLLRAVENGDGFDAGRQARQEILRWKGPVEVKLAYAHLFAARHQVLHGLLCGFCARAHDDNDSFRIGSPGIVGQMILAAGDCGKLVEGVLNNSRDGQVERVDRLTRLKVNVRILCRAADDRVVR
jgi:hypothetical protein